MTTQRDDLALLLPFHANGTLTEPERAEVQAWLDTDDQARAEAADLAAMRADMQAEEFRSPGEFGLARLLRDVDREQTAPIAAPARRPWLWQAVAAVALAGLIGQALLPAATTPEAGFEMAGAGGEVTFPTLTVAFAPDATESALRDLLLAQGAEIVAGPSALGLYQVRADDLAAVQAALAASALVASVEPTAN